MIYYVFDTNALKRIYSAPPQAKNPQKPTSQERCEIKQHKRATKSFAYICSQWIREEVILIVPNFVIAELLNCFAYQHFRNLGKNPTQANKDYQKVKDRFIEQIRYSPNITFEKKQEIKKWFFNYELNRHHILNLDKILPIEHTTEPLKKDQNTSGGKIALSPPDLLLISVGLELEVLVGKGSVFLATEERRLTIVCKNERLPTCYKLDAIRDPEKELPKIESGQTIYSPPAKISA